MKPPERSPISSERDFGGIYTKTPKEIKAPKTIEELAATLSYYNKLSIPVTIRNTGHSANGQTLTDGIQIQLSNLSRVNFDEEKLLVHVEAGCSWDSLLHAIKLPKYCTAVFPNNPRQEIHVGGTAAVGGVGYFSGKFGGFWNIIESITLVTMEGNIIECSRENNRELFAFSLGGYGRIGVIAKLSIRVKKAGSSLLGIGVIYHSETKLLEGIKEAVKNPLFSSISFLQHPLLHFETLPFNIAPCMMGLIVELEKGQEPEKILKNIKNSLGEDFMAYADLSEREENIFSVDISLKKQIMEREKLVYWYPDAGLSGEGIVNPWSDYFIPLEQYPRFFKEARTIIDRYSLRKYLLPQEVNNLLTYHIDGGYMIRNNIENNDKYKPLGLGKVEGEFVYMYGIFLGMPKSEVGIAIKMIDEVTDLAYSLGGIRYLYGVHNLTRSQMEQHYGADTIKKWQELKSKTDPKMLLNIGVVPHLD